MLESTDGAVINIIQEIAREILNLGSPDGKTDEITIYSMCYKLLKLGMFANTIKKNLDGSAGSVMFNPAKAKILYQIRNLIAHVANRITINSDCQRNFLILVSREIPSLAIGISEDSEEDIFSELYYFLRKAQCDITIPHVEKPKKMLELFEKLKRFAEGNAIVRTDAMSMVWIEIGEYANILFNKLKDKSFVEKKELLELLDFFGKDIRGDFSHRYALYSKNIVRKKVIMELNSMLPTYIEKIRLLCDIVPIVLSQQDIEVEDLVLSLRGMRATP